MTRVFRGHFDGKAIVPDGPVDLPRRKKLIVHVESENSSDKQGMSGQEFLKAMQALKFPKKDLKEINQAIQG